MLSLQSKHFEGKWTAPSRRVRADRYRESDSIPLLKVRQSDHCILVSSRCLNLRYSSSPSSTSLYLLKWMSLALASSSRRSRSESDVFH